jgi:cation transport ATPase
VFPKRLPSRRNAIATCLVAALTLLVCAALLIGAVLAHAPAAVLPLVALVCVGCPLALGWSLPASIAILRATEEHHDARTRAVHALRSQLDRLPETRHPLGL